jgi:hypothetical protein
MRLKEKTWLTSSIRNSRDITDLQKKIPVSADRDFFL